MQFLVKYYQVYLFSSLVLVVLALRVLQLTGQSFHLILVLIHLHMVTKSYIRHIRTGLSIPFARWFLSSNVLFTAIGCFRDGVPVRLALSPPGTPIFLWGT